MTDLRTLRGASAVICAIQFFLVSCAGSPSSLESVDSGSEEQVEERSSGRRELTAEECKGAGGQVIGDPGDGRIFRPDYRCPETGEPPIGTVVAGGTGVIAIEGSVCCAMDP